MQRVSWWFEPSQPQRITTGLRERERERKRERERGWASSLRL